MHTHALLFPCMTTDILEQNLLENGERNRQCIWCTCIANGSRVSFFFARLFTYNFFVRAELQFLCVVHEKWQNLILSYGSSYHRFFSRSSALKLIFAILFRIVLILMRFSFQFMCVRGFFPAFLFVFHFMCSFYCTAIRIIHGACFIGAARHFFVIVGRIFTLFDWKMVGGGSLFCCYCCCFHFFLSVFCQPCLCARQSLCICHIGIYCGTKRSSPEKTTSCQSVFGSKRNNQT